MAGQIMIVNGTSGSGKSTTCELFAKRSDEFWLRYGIDHFLAASFPSKFGHHGLRCKEGIYAEPVTPDDPEGPLRWRFGGQGTRGFAVMHEWVAAASRAGCNIILDHLLLSDPPVLQDCIWRLQGLPVLLVTLKPPFDVLMERVASREMGGKGAASGNPDEEALQRIRERLQRLRPWFYEAIYANPVCDLEVDTVEHGPEAVCELIEARLAQGPGRAFGQLREEYPHPDAGSESFK